MSYWGMPIYTLLRARLGGCHCIESWLASPLTIFPCLTAMSSARMLTAISCGVTAPISRPMRCMHTLERFHRHAVGSERLIDPSDLGPASDEAQVAQLTRRKRTKCFEVVGMSAGHDDDVSVERKAGMRQPGRDVLGHDLGGGRETLAVGELLAVVDDVHLKADLLGQIGQVRPDVAGADHVQLG